MSPPFLPTQPNTLARANILRSLLCVPVMAGALGYFVDAYDLVVFSVVRRESLQYLGIASDQLLSVGVLLLNWQLVGLVIGGLFWGSLADRMGRVQGLFGSILLYSLANIANSFVTTIDMYALCRFVAGFGLAGELGVALTLACETLPKEVRGYGTALLCGIGLLGAITAGLVGGLFPWQRLYQIGGVLGLLVLGFRWLTTESALFLTFKDSSIPKGNLRQLLGSRKWATRLGLCVLVGFPIWYVPGVIATFGPEIGENLGVQGNVLAGRAILWATIGVTLGDIILGILSQRWRGRKRAIFAGLGMAVVAIILLPAFKQLSPTHFYVFCLCVGMCTGYGAVLLTLTAESFGTNLRATATTSVPNFFRGAATVLLFLFNQGRPHMGVLMSVVAVGVFAVAVAALALSQLPESFGRDLNFEEG